MTGQQQDGSTAADRADRARREAERRRRRALVFGEVLPEATSDERDEQRPDAGGDRSEEWLRRQVPPHHG